MMRHVAVALMLWRLAYATYATHDPHATYVATRPRSRPRPNPAPSRFVTGAVE